MGGMVPMQLSDPRGVQAARACLAAHSPCDFSAKIPRMQRPAKSSSRPDDLSIGRHQLEEYKYPPG